MNLIINEDKCARCGVCGSECPVEAIFQTEDAYMIDPSLCNGCLGFGGSLCKTACPNDAIYKTNESLYRKCLRLFS